MFPFNVLFSNQPLRNFEVDVSTISCLLLLVNNSSSVASSLSEFYQNSMLIKHILGG